MTCASFPYGSLWGSLSLSLWGNSISLLLVALSHHPRANAGELINSAQYSYCTLCRDENTSRLHLTLLCPSTRFDAATDIIITSLPYRRLVLFMPCSSRPSLPPVCTLLSSPPPPRQPTSLALSRRTTPEPTGRCELYCRRISTW